MLELPLIQATQLAVSSRLIVFNCYKIVKIRWYQKGIFKFLIAIVISIVTAFVFPGAAGLLGPALSVGSALGFTGTMAIIMGAAVNAIAGMILTTIIQKGAVLLLGEKWGAVLGSILPSFASYVSSFANTGKFYVDWGAMFRADNLLSCDLSSDMVTKWAQGEISEIQGDITKAGADYKAKSAEIQKKTLDLLGYGGGMIDPLIFTEITSGSSAFMAESSGAFLSRTLMTGSDIVDLSMSIIEDFSDLSLQLPDAFM